MPRNPALVVLNRLFLVAVTGLAAGACANPFAEDAPTLDQILSAGWIWSDEPVEVELAEESPLYCYGTIGTEDCHSTPLPDEENRLVGFQGPPPPSRDDL